MIAAHGPRDVTAQFLQANKNEEHQLKIEQADKEKKVQYIYVCVCLCAIYIIIHIYIYIYSTCGCMHVLCMYHVAQCLQANKNEEHQLKMEQADKEKKVQYICVCVYNIRCRNLSCII